MLEKEMEDLIALYPGEFLPRHELTLQGRQGTFPDVGRYDLLFRDQFGTQIVMELKAGTAKYEDATQLAKYRDALGRKHGTHVLMWLVAPHIPKSVREFLDQVGIEYTEIHEAEFRRVAERQGYSFIDKSIDQEARPVLPNRVSVDRNALEVSIDSGAWFLNTDEGETPGIGAYRRMIMHSCAALWGFPDRGDPEERLALPSTGDRVFLYLNRAGVIASGRFSHEPPKPGDFIFGKKAEREFHRGITDLIAVDKADAIPAADVFRATGCRLPSLRAFCRLTSSKAAEWMLSELRSKKTILSF